MSGFTYYPLRLSKLRILHIVFSLQYDYIPNAGFVFLERIEFKGENRLIRCKIFLFLI